VAKGQAVAQPKNPAFGKDFGLGWVGFVHSGSRLSKGIAYLTRREKQSGVTITHALVVTGPAECVEANLPAGVVTSDLSKEYLGRDDRTVVFRKPKGLTQATGRRIAERAKAQVGAKFDFGGFAATGVADTFVGHFIDVLLDGAPKEKLAGLLHQKGRFVCSDLVAYCLRQERRYRDVKILAHPPGTLSPQALFEDEELFEQTMKL
jgi:hypothetical protein